MKLNKKYSLIAGTCYVLLFFLAIFANFLVLESLIVDGNIQQTITNIQDNEFVYRLGSIFFLLIAILDVVIAWALYYLFKPINESLSLISAWSRLAYTVVLAVLVSCLAVVLQFLDQPSIVDLLLQLFDFGWMIGLAIFGLHLIFVGILLIKAKRKLLGVLLILAAAMYILDTLTLLLFSSYSLYSGVILLFVAVPAVIAELSFTLWLLYCGLKK